MARIFYNSTTGWITRYFKNETGVDQPLHGEPYIDLADEDVAGILQGRRISTFRIVNEQLVPAAADRPLPSSLDAFLALPDNERWEIVFSALKRLGG